MPTSPNPSRRIGPAEKKDYEPSLPVASWQTTLSPALMRQFQAGYFGCINHIDDQLSRVLARLPGNTVVIFTSDHGEMLGDHHFIRKTRALEGSARVPFLHATFVRAGARLRVGPARRE